MSFCKCPVQYDSNELKNLYWEVQLQKDPRGTNIIDCTAGGHFLIVCNEYFHSEHSFLLIFFKPFLIIYIITPNSLFHVPVSFLNFYSLTSFLHFQYQLY